MATDTRRLRSEHASLAAIATEMAALADPKQPNAAALSALRWRLCRELLAHLATEDRFLYPRLLASADENTARTAREYALEMGGLANIFTLYMENWTAERIANHWSEFCVETTGLLTALGTRIQKENTVLYPLAEVG